MDEDNVFHGVGEDKADKSDIPTQKSFASLEDIMESEDFNNFTSFTFTSFTSFRIFPISFQINVKCKI